MAKSKKRDHDIDPKPSDIERLVTWIRRVRRKKLRCRRNRRRDLRIEAMLTCTLFKAEDELRIKQSSRALKLRKLKKQLLKKANYINYKRGDDEDTSQQNNPSKEPELCPELSSLDDAISKLSEVKVSLQH
ncbi:uncharacterized protein [Bombus fervidus]|uniref:uncharacterized protein n=1 Tax=Bombus fervidus TaxID=203811 RepID=UPI003D188817